MIVVDVETSGTDPQAHSLLSIGAVNFSDPSDYFSSECRMWDGAHIDPKGLEVNGFTKQQITNPLKQTEAELIESFLIWVDEKLEHTIAGQNPHGDLAFLHAAARRAHANFTLAHRLIDLHSIAYAHMIGRGIEPPRFHKHSGLNSDAIMKYVGIPPEPKPHIALNGALWETEAFSRLLYNAPLLEQFKQYPLPW